MVPSAPGPRLHPGPPRLVHPAPKPSHPLGCKRPTGPIPSVDTLIRYSTWVKVRPGMGPPRIQTGSKLSDVMPTPPHGPLVPLGRSKCRIGKEKSQKSRLDWIGPVPPLKSAAVGVATIRLQVGPEFKHRVHEGAFTERVAVHCRTQAHAGLVRTVVAARRPDLVCAALPTYLLRGYAAGNGHVCQHA